MDMSGRLTPVAISALEVVETADVEVGVPVVVALLMDALLVALLMDALLELTTVLKVDGTLGVGVGVKAVVFPEAEADVLPEADVDELADALLLLLETATHAFGTSSRDTIKPVPSGSGDIVSPTAELQVSW